MAIQERSTILKNATAIGPGAAFNLYNTYSTFTFMKRTSGAFTALTVNLEGSVDGTNWYQIGTDTTLVDGATFAVDKPSRYVRANVTAFTGGTNVSVDMLPAPVV